MNKKVIYLIFLTIFVIILICFIFVFIKRRVTNINEIELNNIKSMKFSYSTGNMINAYVRYNIDYKDYKYIATIKPNNISEEEAKEIEIDKNTLENIVNVLNKYKVYHWNNFHKNDKRVLDGNSFSFTLSTTDGKDIDASGYMMWPENYRNVRDELDAIFNNLYKGGTI